MIHIIPEVFDEQFWSRAVYSMSEVVQPDSGEGYVPCVVLVPDASMYVPYQFAWRDHAKAQGRAIHMPVMQTVLDWAKQHGSPDWDADRLERVLQWAQLLQDTPRFARWLGASALEQPDFSGLLNAADYLVSMSDELSLHVLPGQAIETGLTELAAVVHEVYQTAGGHLAQEELDVLLQCWQLDVGMQPPIVQFLNTLQERVEEDEHILFVVRNRPWLPYEVWFYERYAQSHEVYVWDIQTTRARIANRHYTSVQRAWAHQEGLEHYGAYPCLEPGLLSDQGAHGVLYAAPHAEDEAHAVVKQIMAWREQGLKKIAVVALDRAVSRRVWSLLLHNGVTMRDDTGWLLSTSRLSHSWSEGLKLWVHEPTPDTLLSWLAHPAVLSDVMPEHKTLLIQYLKALAVRSSTVIRDWGTWANAIERRLPDQVWLGQAQVLECELHQMARDWIRKAQSTQLQWTKKRKLSQWAEAIEQWAQDFGLWSAWQSEVKNSAEQQWLALMNQWRLSESGLELSAAALLTVIGRESEVATYRAHDASDEVLLLPLGSTRMRHFDAVWVLGADAKHLPSNLDGSGLLNTAVRTRLGLPNAVTVHAQMRRDFIDLLVSSPVLIGSYSLMVDGQLNAASPWWQQWLRACGQTEQPLTLVWQTVAPAVSHQSMAQLDENVPHIVTASDLNQLAACPYQYYVRRVLGVREQSIPTDQIMPSTIGNLWHGILADFHEQRGQAATVDELTGQMPLELQDDASLLRQLIERRLRPLCARNPRYWEVRENFILWMEPYLQWWARREAEGWRRNQSEVVVHVLHDIHDPALGSAGLKLMWRGTIDQVDVREQLDSLSGVVTQEWSLIDYKTNEGKAIKDKFLKPILKNEDVQLAFYLHLVKGMAPTAKPPHVVQAGYVGVTDQPVYDTVKLKPHEGDNDYPQAWLNAQPQGEPERLIEVANELHQKVDDTFKRMQTGEPLLAMGELRVCEFCEARGLCRKGHTRKRA